MPPLSIGVTCVAIGAPDAISRTKIYTNAPTRRPVNAAKGA
jgi:hypothetical protein